MQKRMIKGVLFDMDGVLLDTERPSAEAYRAAARAMGADMPDSLLQTQFGVSAGAARGYVAAHYGPAFDCDRFFSGVARLQERERAQNGLRLMPGVREVLEELARRGLALAVASTTRSARVAQHLGEAGISGFFSAAVGGDMVRNAKPAPDIFLAAAAALGLPPAECAAVEDSYAGVAAAAAAGCVTVMIPDVMPATDTQRALCAAVLPCALALLPFLRSVQGAADLGGINENPL